MVKYLRFTFSNEIFVNQIFITKTDRFYGYFDSSEHRINCTKISNKVIELYECLHHLNGVVVRLVVLLFDWKRASVEIWLHKIQLVDQKFFS